jgi:hypothetical protein
LPAPGTGVAGQFYTVIRLINAPENTRFID